MKKIGLLSLVISLLCGNFLMAQGYKSFPLNNNKGNGDGTVYFLPKTELVIRFKVEKVTRTQGIYSQSAYLLGIDNSALKNDISYRVLSADICERIAPNEDKKYLINASDKFTIERTSAGTLKSVIAKGNNSNSIVGKDENGQNGRKHIKYEKENIQNNVNTSLAVIPTYEQKLLQRGLLTKYPQMTAEKTVAEIKRLREKQIELLSGGWEGTYMNTTVDYMYKQLDEIINSYVSLFTGIEESTIEEYVFVITPEKPIILEEDLIVPVCKFSQTAGLLDLNEKGEGIKINARLHSYVTTDQNSKTATGKYISEQTKKKLDKEGAGVYYIQPQNVKVTLQGVDMQNTSKIVKLMQYGNINYTTDHNSNVLFDENTGELLRMW